MVCVRYVSTIALVLSDVVESLDFMLRTTTCESEGGGTAQPSEGRASFNMRILDDLNGFLAP